jgi:hypothetical protein
MSCHFDRHVAGARRERFLCVICVRKGERLDESHRDHLAAVTMSALTPQRLWCVEGDWNRHSAWSWKVTGNVTASFVLHCSVSGFTSALVLRRLIGGFEGAFSHYRLRWLQGLAVASALLVQRCLHGSSVALIRLQSFGFDFSSCHKKVSCSCCLLY